MSERQAYGRIPVVNPLASPILNTLFMINGEGEETHDKVLSIFTKTLPGSQMCHICRRNNQRMRSRFHMHGVGQISRQSRKNTSSTTIRTHYPDSEKGVL